MIKTSRRKIDIPSCSVNCTFSSSDLPSSSSSFWALNLSPKVVASSCSSSASFSEPLPDPPKALKRGVDLSKELPVEPPGDPARGRFVAGRAKPWLRPA